MIAAASTRDEVRSVIPDRAQLANIAIRLRDMAGVLAESGLHEAAASAAQAHGQVLGHLTTLGINL